LQAPAPHACRRRTPLFDDETDVSKRPFAVEMERLMTRKAAPEIYMMKKSANGSIVSFRLGTDHGVRPGMQLRVLNEDGIPVGSVKVLFSTEGESEALVAGESRIKLGCRINLPAEEVKSPAL